MTIDWETMIWAQSGYVLGAFIMHLIHRRKHRARANFEKVRDEFLRTCRGGETHIVRSDGTHSVNLDGYGYGEGQTYLDALRRALG